MNIQTFLRRAANKLGYTLQPKKEPDPDALALRHVIEVVLSLKPNATFIEIGANDGVTYDPLYNIVKERKLKGIAIEPQPDAFEILRQNYADIPSVTCLNLAIADHKGTHSLYVLSSGNLRTLFASFNKDVISRTARKRIPKGANPDEYIRKIEVPCDTLKNILSFSPDFYHIDCEGYDFEVIKQIDFTKPPLLINYEHTHLSREDELACQELLHSHGYKWFKHHVDTCAYKI